MAGCGRWRSPPRTAPACCPTCRPWPRPGWPATPASSWQSLQAPAGTPPPIVARLAAAATAALAEPAAQARYAEAGVEPLSGSPAEAARFIRAETAKWGPILRATGARAG